VTFFVFTTGCKANQWDSHVLEGRLEGAGLTRAAAGQADLIVVNACSLTARAEVDARRFIRKAKEANPRARIALVGCHAQVYPGRDFGADLVLGQAEKFDAGRYLSGVGRFVGEVRDTAIEQAWATGGRKDRTRFFFKIQDGCKRFCAYCIVPYARGPVRSRPAREVAEMMEALERQGVKEIVLTGIDLAAYRDPASQRGLKELLTFLDERPTPPRIRLSSVDPGYIDDAFISVVAASRKIAKSIHIPVQSGSDRVLAAMGRAYSAASIRALVGKLKGSIPDIGIGMDVMAGFPGEDEEDFKATLGMVEDLAVSYLHIFPYSDREGARASSFAGKVAEGVKRRRAKMLKLVDARKREAFLRRHIGRTARIIPEGKVYRGRLMRGFSDNYLPVYMPYEKTLENNLVDVTIREMQDGRLIGGPQCS
jgi:threonylcarbamoyladenosine tRNA methylthiotransferase MtaB